MTWSSLKQHSFFESLIQFIDYKHSWMPKTETFEKDSENYFASILDNFYLKVLISFCYS